MNLKTDRRKFLGRLLGCLTGGWLISFQRIGSAATVYPCQKVDTMITLPAPKTTGTVALEQTIAQRRTVRRFHAEPIGRGQLSQLLWAAQGITEQGGFKRAAPSAGALYPMDLYAVIGDHAVAKLDAGVYHYQPARHRLTLTLAGDIREKVSQAALSQTWMADAAINLVITAEYSRIAVKYGDRGERYAMIEAGHIGQNIFLQAEALGLKAAIVGAFRDRMLARVLCLPQPHAPLLIMPVGVGL